MFKKMIFITVAVGLFAFSTGVMAKEAAKKNDTEKKASPNLVKVTTLKDAFIRSLEARQQLATSLVSLTKELQAEKNDAKKKALREKIDKTNQALQRVKVAMDVIFGIGNRREYEFIADTIYLKVGTVDETFARALKAREVLKETLAKKTEQKNKAKDDKTIQKLTDEIKEFTKRYQVIASSLQIIFGVTPQANYTFNPQNDTLYLNVTDAQLNEIKAKKAELQKKQDKKAAKKTK